MSELSRNFVVCKSYSFEFQSFEVDASLLRMGLAMHHWHLPSTSYAVRAVSRCQQTTQCKSVATASHLTELCVIVVSSNTTDQPTSNQAASVSEHGFPTPQHPCEEELPCTPFFRQGGRLPQYRVRVLKSIKEPELTWQ